MTQICYDLMHVQKLTCTSSVYYTVSSKKTSSTRILQTFARAADPANLLNLPRSCSSKNSPKKSQISITIRIGNKALLLATPPTPQKISQESVDNSLSYRQNLYSFL